MKRNLLLFSLMLTTIFANAQNSGYFKEGFEDNRFPPKGWDVISLMGNAAWSRSMALAHTGVGSAYDSYNSPKGINYLITPQFTVAASDSLSFWFAAQYVGYPDTLYVQISTTNKAPGSFTTIATFADGDNYPVTDTTWQRVSLALASYAGQNVYIAFKHVDKNGDGIYLDDVAMGTAPADVAALSINFNSNYYLIGSSVNPEATFQNISSSTQTFNVTLKVNGYSSTKTISNLASQGIEQVTFDSWVTPLTPNEYTVTAYSSLASDVNLSNDTVSKNILVTTTFASDGWKVAKKTPMPAFGTTVSTYYGGISPDDSAFIFEIGGANVSLDGGRKYDVKLNTWSKIAPLPRKIYRGSAFTFKNKIFVLGGYHGGFNAINTVSIYDIATDTWSEGAPIPLAVGGYAGCQYNDSLIYLIGGYADSKFSDIKKVQIYNAATNTWTAGTDFPGVVCDAAGAGISGNKIVITGGISQALGITLSQTYVGTINPDNPSIISWVKTIDYPEGTIIGLGVTGVKNGLQPYVYFTGGDPDGSGTIAYSSTWAYDVNSNLWLLGPTKPTGVNNLNNFASFTYNDTVYIASVGGYDGTNISDANEWLVLGSTSQVLPIHLISFTAALQNNRTTLLNWKVAEDGTGGYYTIQRSSDGAHFTDMTGETKAGRIATTMAYAGQDLLPFKGYTYYRIKIVNSDGSMSYSAIRAVDNNLAGTVTMAASVYPNPSRGVVNVLLQNNGNANATIGITISDIAGRKMVIDNKTIGTSVSLAYTLKPGTYIINMFSQDGSFKQSQKVIVE